MFDAKHFNGLFLKEEKLFNFFYRLLDQLNEKRQIHH